MPRPLKRVCLEEGLKLDLNHLIRDGTIKLGAATSQIIVWQVAGSRELAGWALKKEEHAQQLAHQEKRSSGYAVRLHALSPWVSHVLS